MAETETVVETTETNVNDTNESGQVNSETGRSEGLDELAKLKAELAKQKEAINKATKEAAEYKRALRAKQSDEEIAAEERKAQDEARDKELEELRRKVAKAETIKSVMGKLGTDETVSGKLADHLYGAEDVEAALTELQRFWTAKEKALRLEYGKIPAPGVGSTNGEDPELQKAIKLAQDLGRERAGNGKSLAEDLKSYLH